MEKSIKELVETLLQAIIEDGKAGINNSIQDRDWDLLDFESSKIDDAVMLFLQLENDEDNINFEFLSDSIKKSIAGQCTMTERINQLLDWYESVKDKTFNFNNDVIKELAKLMGQ